MKPVESPGLQPATLHGPRRFSALRVYDAAPAAAAAVVETAAKLLATTEGLAATSPPQILVALAPQVIAAATTDADKRRRLEEGARIPVLDSGPVDGPAMPATPGCLLVQVAAHSPDDRRDALKLIDAIVKAPLSLREEAVGERTLAAREMFGYPDGPPPALRRRLGVSDGTLEGGTWLLYQRYVQNVDAFMKRAPEERDRIIGRSVKGRPIDGVDDAHTARVRGAPIVRRGFPYERGGERGLVFLGLASSPEEFKRALDRMRGTTDGPRDALLGFARAVEGGVYFVPPSSAWLLQVERPQNPWFDRLFQRRPVVSYELTPPAFAYMERLRTDGLLIGDPGAQSLAPGVAPVFRALHTVLAGRATQAPNEHVLLALKALQHAVAGGAIKVDFTPLPPDGSMVMDAARDELDRLLAEATEAANAVNAEQGLYVTISG